MGQDFLFQIAQIWNPIGSETKFSPVWTIRTFAVRTLQHYARPFIGDTRDRAIDRFP
jgi:hypothetical protein